MSGDDFVTIVFNVWANADAKSLFDCDSELDELIMNHESYPFGI